MSELVKDWVKFVVIDDIAGSLAPDASQKPCVKSLLAAFEGEPASPNEQAQAIINRNARWNPFSGSIQEEKLSDFKQSCAQSHRIVMVCG